MRQSAYLVFNPIMVDNYANFSNCMKMGRASDSMMAPVIKLFILVSLDRSFLSVAWPTGIKLVFFVCSGFSIVVQLAESVFSFLIQHDDNHDLYVRA